MKGQLNFSKASTQELAAMGIEEREKAEIERRAKEEKERQDQLAAWHTQNTITNVVAILALIALICGLAIVILMPPAAPV